MKKLISILLLLIAGTVQAQVINIGGPGQPRALTIEESYLNGMARVIAAQGYYLESLNRAAIDHETARRLYIDNWAHKNRTRWAIQDERRERYHRDNPSYLEQWERRLNQAERAHALKQREKDLIARGVLPPKPEPGFIVRGKKFSTLEEYYASNEYVLEQNDRRIRKLEAELEEQLEAERQFKALQRLRMWDKMTFLERQNYSRLGPVEREEYRKEFFDPEYQSKRLQERSDERFYEIRPSLRPQR